MSLYPESYECERCGGMLKSAGWGPCSKCEERWKPQLMLVEKLGRNLWHCRALALGMAEMPWPPPLARGGAVELAAQVEIGRAGMARFWVIVDPFHFARNSAPRAIAQKLHHGMIAWGQMDQIPYTYPGCVASVSLSLGRSAA